MWDANGLEWCVGWMDRQDEADDYEAWRWYAEGKIGGETTIVTP